MIEQIQSTNNSLHAQSPSNLLGCVARILVLLAAIQAIRAGITWVQYATLHPALHSSTWTWMGIAAFTLTGILLLAIFRPSAQSLGLTWNNMSRLERVLTILFGMIWLGLVLTSLSFSPELLLGNIRSAVIIPVFEELLFRGWVWQKLEGAMPGKHRGLLTWLGTSLLFSVWHLGYMDSYLLKALPANPDLTLVNLLSMKLLYTLGYGLVIGFFRWRTGRVYGSIWMHGLINLFGR